MDEEEGVARILEARIDQQIAKQNQSADISWQKVGRAPLHEHLRAAEFAWDTIRKRMPEVPSPMRGIMLAEFRKDARRSFWLYPLVEARRGLPA